MTQPPTSAPPRHQLLYAILLLGTGLLAFWQIGRLPLLDNDEPVYGQVAKEMAPAGWAGWLTPHYNGALWFDKPPLFYWLSALSVRVLGVSEWAVRLPSALLGVALVAVTCALARRAFPRAPRAGLWAGYVLATSVQFFLLARAAVTDMTLAVCLMTALLALYAWTTTGRGRWMALAGLMTGLAALAKGPVAIVLLGLHMVAFLCLTRQPRRLLAPALWGGFALCLVVSLPWYLAMIRLHGGAFVQGFLEANNVTRFLQPEHKATQNFFWYVPVFAGLFLPWTLTLPGALTAARAENQQERQEPSGPRPVLFLGLWSALVFLFFSFSQTKLLTYVFPIAPTVAILVGRWLAERSAQTPPDRAARVYGTVYAVGLMGVAGGLLAVGLQYHADRATIALWMAVLVTAAILSLTLAPTRGRWLAPGAAFALMLLIGWCSPTWKTRESEVSERGAGLAARQATAPGDPVYALHQRHPSLVYYSGRHVVFTDSLPDAVQDLNAHPGRVYEMQQSTLRELTQTYGLHGYRVLFRGTTTIVVQAAPAANETPYEQTPADKG